MGPEDGECEGRGEESVFADFSDLQEDVYSPHFFLSCYVPNADLCDRYWEAIVSFFESVTPVFTSSEDAYHFFNLKPHPFLGSFRSVEFSFTNPNDHLFLAQVQREQDDTPPPAAVGPNTGDHPCLTVPCRLEVFGQQLWAQLVQGVKTRVPDLRDFDITIVGRLNHAATLTRFGPFVEGDEEVEVEQKEEGQSAWALPGRLTVLFKTDEQRYVQNNGVFVRQR